MNNDHKNKFIMISNISSIVILLFVMSLEMAWGAQLGDNNIDVLDIGRTFLSLGFIVALILGVAWFTKKIQIKSSKSNNNMKVIEVLALSSRERVVLIDVAGKQILLGVSGSNINRLHEFKEVIVTSKDIKKNNIFNEKLQDAITRVRTS